MVPGFGPGFHFAIPEISLAAQIYGRLLVLIQVTLRGTISYQKLHI